MLFCSPIVFQTFRYYGDFASPTVPNHSVKNNWQVRRMFP
nr:MAG TPA: restriction endonuclease [Caudoviricetes sp.]